MKNRLFILAVLVCLAVHAYGQEKGQWWIGGSITYSDSDVGDYRKTSTFRFGPEFGYAFSNKWSLGLDLAYSVQDYDYVDTATTSNLDSNTKIYSVSPFARYSFCRGKIGNFFIDGRLGYARNVQKNTSEGSDASKYNSNYFDLDIRPGVALKLGKHVLATASISIFNVSYAKNEGSKTFNIGANNNGFSLGNLAFGLNYCF